MAQLSDAKKEFGVWSSLGAEESRSLFWWVQVMYASTCCVLQLRTCLSSLNDVRPSAGSRSKPVRFMGDDKPSGT